MRIDPNTIATKDLHQFIVAAVSPRPIALASTVDAAGQPNLAPYSFFNAFSSNPPILIFSSNRRVKDNTTKDTLANIEETMQVVINVVNHDILRQMTIASIEYDKHISEFEKAGLTPMKSELVKPFRVKESPIQMECQVKEIIRLGDQGGAGNLFVCQVVMMHIDDNVLSGNRINPQKLDVMGRLGRAYYVRVKGDAINAVYQPSREKGMGFDNLPASVIQSDILTGNDLAQLAALPDLPKIDIFQDVQGDPRLAVCQQMNQPKAAIHYWAKELISKGEIQKALAVLIVG